MATDYEPVEALHSGTLVPSRELPVAFIPRWGTEMSSNISFKTIKILAEVWRMERIFSCILKPVFFLSLQMPCTTTNLNGWLHNNGSDIWRDLYIAANLYRMYQSHTSKIPQTISIHTVVNMIILFIYFMQIKYLRFSHNCCYLLYYYSKYILLKC